MYNFESKNYDPCRIPTAGEILEMIGHKPKPDPVRLWKITLTINDKVVGRGVRKMTRAQVIEKCDLWYCDHYSESDVGYTIEPVEE